MRYSISRRDLGRTMLGAAAVNAAHAVDSPRTGILRVTRGPADLRIPIDTPARDRAIDLGWHLPGAPVEETWRYGVTAPFQVGPRTGGLFVNVRRDYGPGIDFEIGNDVVLFDDDSQIHERRMVPLTRLELSRNPRSSPPGERCVLIKQRTMGGFIPLGSKRGDGSPHPHAGTGCAINQAIAWPLHNNDLHDSFGTEPLRRQPFQGSASYAYWELHQLAYDGETFRILETEHIPIEALIPGMIIGNTGLQSAIPDGDDLLTTLSRRDGCGVSRWTRTNNRWRPVSYIPVTGTQGSGEPSLIQDIDGSWLIGVRGRNEAEYNAIRVFCSRDHGETWERIINVASAISSAPVTLNRAADGTPYVAANLNEVLLRPMRKPFREEHDSFGRRRRGGWLRQTMYAWPLNADREELDQAVLIRALGSEFGPPPGGTTWRVDHPFSYTVRLADGDWHHLIGVRVCESGEVDHQIGPAPETGGYVEEVISAGRPIPIWNF